jgi:hypothetical protein
MSSIDSMVGAVPANIMLWFAIAYNIMASSYISFAEFVKKINTVYTALTCPEYYIFFKNSAYPYLLRNTHAWATGSAVPEFIYWADSKVFMPWVSNDVYYVAPLENGNTLPMLSLELVNTSDETVAYDLTDFIERVRYMGESIPTLNQVIAVWTLASNVVPNLNEMKIRYVNEDGETIVILNGVCLLEGAVVEDAVVDDACVEDALDRELSEDAPISEVENVSTDCQGKTVDYAAAVDCLEGSDCCVQS